MAQATMPNAGRTAAIGYVIGFVVTTIAITAIGAIAGMGASNALGLGAFVGVWGGGGFGFMLGGVIPLGRYFDEMH